MSQSFHLIKRKNKKGTVYFAAFLDSATGENGKPRYKAMKSTRVGNRSAAEKIARQMLADGTVTASRESIRGFLLDFWNPQQSAYLKRQRTFGIEISTMYCKNNRQRIEDFFLPFFESRGLNQLADLTRRNLEEWQTYLHEHGYLPESEKRQRRITAATMNRTR